ARRYLQRHGTLRRRHLDLRPERGLAERDRDVDDEIGVAPLVDRRGGHARDHVQVARRPAVHAGLALAAQADPRPVLDPGRDLDRVALRPALAARAVAAGARILDHGAVAAAARTRRRQPEEALALD